MTDLSAQAAPDDIARRLPAGDEIFLDHVGHFVRDGEAASRALVRCGFAPTPISIQVNPDTAGGSQPTGTGNVTAMLERGYLEILFKTSDTPLGRELETALSRHAGVHLAAFAVVNADKAHRRLAADGFAVRALVHMQRPVETASGAATAAFSIARVEPEAMPEGRIQLLTHHTEQAVWQERWLKHPNSAIGLIDVVIAVANVEEAAQRFARFTGRAATRTPGGALVRLDRGGVQPERWQCRQTCPVQTRSSLLYVLRSNSAPFAGHGHLQKSGKFRRDKRSRSPLYNSGPGCRWELLWHNRGRWGQRTRHCL